MDDRRFDSITRSLASGASRRSVLKGILGLGGATLAGSATLDNDADAARRRTPTPTPVRCPGNQTPVDGVCTCPESAPFICGPACCTGESGDPPNPTHTECCDGACCHGTCYGEELCCPTNPGLGEQPPTHQICTSAKGIECCPYDQRCCEVDGCCDTVCWGGEDDISNCCPADAYCPGNDSPDLCCTNDFICCGAGTSGNLCRDPNVANGCCETADCPAGQICDGNLCVTPCGPSTVQVFAQTHGPIQSPDVCPGPYQAVIAEIGLYQYANGACGSTPIATATTEESAPAVFTNVPAGQYCALPVSDSLSGCLDCPDFGSGVGVNLTVPCGETVQFDLGIASCCIDGQKVAVFVHAPSNCNQGTALSGVPVELADCDSGATIFGPVSSNNDGFADFESVPLGTYCVRVPASSPYHGCESCQSEGSHYQSRIEVKCGYTTYPVIGICQVGQLCDDGTCVVDPCGGRCTTLQICQDTTCVCKAGTHIDSNSGGCTPCIPGTFSKNPDSRLCATCGLNTYQDQSGQTSCLPCPPNTYTNRTGQTACLACDCAAGNMPDICNCPLVCGAGSAPDASNMCAPCPTGTYSVDGTACTPCSPGTFNNLPGNYTCANCAPNAYQDQPGQASCLPCADGYYTAGEGASSCIACDCQAGNMPDICNCPVVCGAGSAPDESNMCAPCPTGTYSVDGTACTPCGAGTFNNTVGNWHCLDCAPGTYTAVLGSSECTPCTAGTFNTGGANYTCYNCPTGTYSASGAQACTQCDVGSYNDVPGSATCTPCPIGTHSTVIGATACTPCDAGTFTNSTGTFLCPACAPGTSSEAGAISCTLCVAGTYAGAGAPACTACAAGTYSGAGSSTCTACAAGTYSGAGAATCLTCDCGSTCDPVSGTCP